MYVILVLIFFIYVGFQTAESLHRHTGPPGRDHRGLLEDAVGTQLHHRGHAHQTTGDGPGNANDTGRTSMHAVRFQEQLRESQKVWDHFSRSAASHCSNINSFQAWMLPFVEGEPSYHTQWNTGMGGNQNATTSYLSITDYILWYLCTVFSLQTHLVFQDKLSKFKHKFPTRTNDPEEILWFCDLFRGQKCNTNKSVSES